MRAWMSSKFGQIILANNNGMRHENSECLKFGQTRTPTAELATLESLKKKILIDL